MARLNLAPWQTWWVDFDPQLGREQAGRRPAIVVGSPFHNALATPLALVIPVTSTNRGLPYHVPVSIQRGRTSYALTEQVTACDHERFDDQIGRLSAVDIAALRLILPRMVAW